MKFNPFAITISAFRQRNLCTEVSLKTAISSWLAIAITTISCEIILYFAIMIVLAAADISGNHVISFFVFKQELLLNIKDIQVPVALFFVYLDVWTIFSIFVILIGHELGHLLVMRYFSIPMTYLRIGKGPDAKLGFSLLGVPMRIGTWPFEGRLENPGSDDRVKNAPFFHVFACTAIGPLVSYVTVAPVIYAVYLHGKDNMSTSLGLLKYLNFDSTFWFTTALFAACYILMCIAMLIPVNGTDAHCILKGKFPPEDKRPA